MVGLSVIDPPFLLGLGSATIVVLALGWVRFRRRPLRFGVRALGVVLAVALVASAVNARYAYLPTVASLLGRTAADQVSPSELRALEHRRPSDEGARGRLAIASGGASAAPERGVVVGFVIPPAHSHFHARTAEVYLPPAYFDTPRPQLPVIELLHGTPGSPADWTRAGDADLTADAYASRHDGFAPILVMPDVNGSWDGDSECVDGRRGRVQTYLTTDVRDAVIDRFHTRRDANGWAIAGLSEGGYCALQIGLRHPELYGAIGDFSGGEGPSVAGGLGRLFAGSAARAHALASTYDPAVLLRDWSGPVKPPIWFEVGTDDVTLHAMAKLDLLARADGFDSHFFVQNGTDHGFASWSEALRDSLPWIASTLAVPELAALDRA